MLLRNIVLVFYLGTSISSFGAGLIGGTLSGGGGGGGIVPTNAVTAGNNITIAGNIVSINTNANINMAAGTSITTPTIIAQSVSSGTFTGNGGSISNLTYPVWNVNALGDSLTISNIYSGNLSYPLILQQLGFNVLTNGGFPGLISAVISGGELDSIAPYFYSSTGQRTIGVYWGGKNDENAMAADLVTMTNVANGIITNITIALYKIWAVGGDAVVVTVPHTAFPPAGPGTFTNSEPCTIYVNQWITNLPSQTNLLQGHRVVIADVAGQYPQTMYTNANGTLNTNVTGDGEHFAQNAMTNVAYIIASSITNSWIWKTPYPTMAANLGGWLNSAPVMLPSGSGITQNAPFGGTQSRTVTFQMGSYIQPAYFEDAQWDILSPTTQDIVGSAWVSGVDENSLATSGFRFMNKGRNWQLFIDTSDGGGLFMGATNLDRTVLYNGNNPSFNLRGQEFLYPTPYTFYPNSCPVNETVMHNELGIFKLGENYNGTPGVATFDGQTFLATNLSAAQNITAGGNLSVGGPVTANSFTNSSRSASIDSGGNAVFNQLKNGSSFNNYVQQYSVTTAGDIPVYQAGTGAILDSGISGTTPVFTSSSANFLQFTNAINGGTNATAPANTTTIRAWVNFTNVTGGVFKLPLYQ